MKGGFIGLGNIGILIARDLVAAGNAQIVYDVMPEGPAEMKTKGATVATSPADVARNADNIGICVRDDKDVHDVMNGPNGILSAARPGMLVAIHSTVRITTVREIAAAAAKHDVHVVDAPVSRGVGSPPTKGIVFMIGGVPADVERAAPFLEPASLKTVKTGALGTAMALKIANNLLTYLTMVAANDAISIAEAAGLDVQLLADVTSNNGVAGGALTSLLTRRAGKPLPAHVVPPPLDAVAGLGEKDLDCALAVGRDLGLKLPGVTMARDAIRSTVFNLFAPKK